MINPKKEGWYKMTVSYKEMMNCKTLDCFTKKKKIEKVEDVAE